MTHEAEVLALAEKMLDSMLEHALGKPESLVGEAATRCCIAVLRMCARNDNMGTEAALMAIGMRMVNAAKGGRA